LSQQNLTLSFSVINFGKAYRHYRYVKAIQKSPASKNRLFSSKYGSLRMCEEIENICSMQ